ncbi:MAG TPA: alpha/beta hydrolase [Bryobacteraceae bacterium]|nr:alpha/beta hydrolase [Bryobacteraceae bacterium]
MPHSNNPTAPALLEVESLSARDGAQDLVLKTTAGPIRARFHGGTAGVPAVIWVFGSGGGVGGPAGGVYERLGQRLAPDVAASLQIDYRRPGDLRWCVADVQIGTEYARSRGHESFVLVGHSFGGAVVISSALVVPRVIAVAALSSQTSGATSIAQLRPRPVFLAHGEDDEILPASCSTTLYALAGEPKELFLYPGCRHGLDACRDQLDTDLETWLRRVLSPDRTSALKVPDPG